MAICRENDSRYDGLFYLAVKTTSIFCLPSCTARFPKPQNISFFDTRKEALSNGYRGCKRCNSAEIQFRPPWIEELLEFFHNSLSEKILMDDLESKLGRHRSTITSVFQRYYSQTPLSYFRKLKMEAARARIMRGKDYREVAFSLGYESISGFRSAYKRTFGLTPGQKVE